MPNNILLETRDPFRKPTWKWDIALMIHRGECDLRDYDDPAILAAVAYLQSTSNDHRRNPIAEAHGLQKLDNAKTWEIQARLLAGETDEEIARTTGYPAEVIQWFAALFFDVRDVRDRQDYIMAQIVGGGPLYGFGDEDVRGFWLWLAAAGGPVLLNFAIQCFRRATPKERAFRLGYCIRPRSPLSLEFQALIAANLLPLDSRTDWFFASLGSEFIGPANVNDNPTARTQLQRKVIQAARLYLAGQPIPVQRQKDPKPSLPDEASKQRAQLLELFSVAQVRCRGAGKQSIRDLTK